MNQQKHVQRPQLPQSHHRKEFWECERDPCWTDRSLSRHGNSVGPQTAHGSYGTVTYYGMLCGVMQWVVVAVVTARYSPAVRCGVGGAAPISARLNAAAAHEPEHTTPVDTHM